MIFAFLVGGIAWRLRGTGLMPDWVARYCVWGFTIGGTILLCTGNFLYAFASVILTGIGASFAYYGDMNVGTTGKSFKNYLILTVMGMSRMLPLCIAATIIGYGGMILPSVLAGASFVPVYLIGYKLPKLSLLSFFTEWGEFLYGGAVLTALVYGLG